MAIVRVACSDCGDVEISSKDVVVRVYSADSTGSCSFKCPTCQRIVVKAVKSPMVELLVTSGVRSVTWHLPEELDEAHDGAPIDHDDLLDFHALLQRDDWIDTLRKMTPG